MAPGGISTENRGDANAGRSGLPLPVGHSLTSGVVCLRVPTPDDLVFIRCMWSDRETMDPVGGPVTLSPEDGTRWYARWIEPGSPDRAYWLVTSGGRPVGEVSFRGFDTSERRATLNVKIAAWERGHGYARPAVEAVLRFFFEDLAGTQMDDDVALNNPIGQSLILSTGFTHDSRAKDVCRLFLTEAQWKARQSA